MVALTRSIISRRAVPSIVSYCLSLTWKRNPNFSRKEIEKFIKDKGAYFDSSLTRSTDILISNDTTSGSSKLRKASNLGVKVINEEEFLRLVEMN